MELEIKTQKIKEVMEVIGRVTAKNPTLPVLSCVLVVVSKNEAIFKATNLDLGVEISVPVKADGSGTIAIPSQTLSALISQIPGQNQTIKMNLSNGNVVISSTKTKGTIKTLPPDDFPTIPRVSDGNKISITTETLIKGLSSVWYSASISSVKPELSSVYIYKNSDSVVFAATDSFRLAEKRVKPEKVGDFPEILIPSKNIAEINRILGFMGDSVDMQSNKNLVSFEKDGIYAVSRIIDGVFPDYRQIVPKSFTTEVVTLKQDLLNALKISNVFSDKFNQVRFVINPKEKVFEVNTKNSDVGENKTAIDASITGDSIEANFNYKYIYDCFQSIDADSISLQLSGANRPMVIRPVSGDQTFMYLVMPMNR